ncbi:hypothetical protein PISMIDRAFT_12204 [Pisolithus microcarpus 441]|uniref:Unplaced genomic scaffold scaffold_66, whole genome shotgun sequence n=1 Tax=Pisolithus microcarpus 441 TaxID=765257 RepID=A0A0C9Z653_9AGAM|nr:hypothetical protein PISMIDRAFT_12204 [Pisolithus microcarpus 441]
MGTTPTVTKKNKQCAATERWLSQPGYEVFSVCHLTKSLTPEFRVREEQREKARLRAARNRTRKHTIDNEDTTCNPIPTSADGSPLDSQPNSCLHPSAHSEIPPLEKMRQLIADWQSEWGAESTWPKKFYEQLKPTLKMADDFCGF